MKSLYIDPITKDLVLNNKNNLRFTTTTAEYTAQKVENKMLFFKGEWWLNVNLGIPYYTDILKKNPNLNLVQSILKSEILSMKGVLELLTFELDIDNSERVLYVNYRIRTETDIVEGRVIL